MKDINMKLLLLSEPNSSHTIKWAKSLALENIDITIFGLGKLNVTDYEGINNINIEVLNDHITNNEGALSKLSYLKALPKIKDIILNFKPDIIHSHYASSYGLLGALSGFHPYIVSVWGGDVFTFPKKTFFHRQVLKFNLSKADKILSTSHIMARETELYTHKNIEITPFGIDLEKFKPIHSESLFCNDDIVIGTVKALENIYGIEYLIKAFKIVSDKHTEFPLKLLIVGGGSLEKELKVLVKNLDLKEQTTFTGKVSFEDVPKYHNMLSISVSVSNNESFGVAIIEASACEKPVIVSDVGGLPEVVEDGISGIIVPPKNPEATANAIEKLILNKTLRTTLGKGGRARVKKLYNWDNNVQQMIQIYKDILK